MIQYGKQESINGHDLEMCHKTILDKDIIANLKDIDM